MTKKRGKRYQPDQIMKILSEAEHGKTVDEVCRKHEVSKTTVYNWRLKYSGMDAANIRRLKEVEVANVSLKKLVASLSCDNQVLKEAATKRY